jgi:hypothetical protein
MVLMAGIQSAAATHTWSNTLGEADLSELVRDRREHARR